MVDPTDRSEVGPDDIDNNVVAVEHRTNATEQAIAVARAMLGAGQPFRPIPHFWSDQWGVEVQAYGLLAGAVDFAVVHGSLADRRSVALYGNGTSVVGALGWRCPRELLAARALVAARTPWADAVGGAAPQARPGNQTAEFARQLLGSG